MVRFQESGHFLGFYLVGAIIVLLKLRRFGVIGSVYMHAGMRENRRRVRDGEPRGFVGGGSLPSFRGAEARRESAFGFRRHIWKCWNSPHARGHPICMLLTSTQPICGRCERRKEGDGREREKKKGGSFIYSVTTSPVSSSSSSSLTQLVCSTPPFIYLVIYFHT